MGYISAVNGSLKNNAVEKKSDNSDEKVETKRKGAKKFLDFIFVSLFVYYSVFVHYKIVLLYYRIVIYIYIYH